MTKGINCTKVEYSTSFVLLEYRPTRRKVNSWTRIGGAVEAVLLKVYDSMWLMWRKPCSLVLYIYIRDYV